MEALFGCHLSSGDKMMNDELGEGTEVPARGDTERIELAPNRPLGSARNRAGDDDGGRWRAWGWRAAVDPSFMGKRAAVDPVNPLPERAGRGERAAVRCRGLGMAGNGAVEPAGRSRTCGKGRRRTCRERGKITLEV